MMSERMEAEEFVQQLPEGNMTVETEVHFDGVCVHLDIVGRYDYDSARKNPDLVNEACRQYECTRVLIDARSLEGDVSICDQLGIAEYMAGSIDRKLTLALVARREQVPNDKFFETALVNRGMSVRVFTDVEEAREWLGAQSLAEARGQ
jgi:hypothetical protein